MKLHRITIPAPPHVPVGPWRIRWTRPSGDTGLNVCIFEDRAEAEYWCGLCQRVCREGCTYEVVPDRAR